MESLPVARFDMAGTSRFLALWLLLHLQLPARGDRVKVDADPGHRNETDSFINRPGIYECVIELECKECIPENMPAVTSHRAIDGRVRVRSGERVALACAGGAFAAYPQRETLVGVCESGRYRVGSDGALRHILHLGCQESIFEDVLHQVEGCGAPLQGRSYQTSERGPRGPRHLAALCYDADRAVAVWARTTSAPGNRLPLAEHAERTAPLTLLGNLNHMFDAKTRSEAQRIHSDLAALNRRLREMFKHDEVAFAGQTLASAKLLSGDYLERQNAQATDFESNRVVVWRSVAEGNLRHVQRDVAALVRTDDSELIVVTGTRGVASLRVGSVRAPIFAREPSRFPAPHYVWTAVVKPSARRALALVVLDDPFVTVSEVRAAVFCESACGSVGWLRELTRHRRYETPLYGLAFCCDLHDFAKTVTEMPRDLLRDIPEGRSGMLTDL